jgi:hypothetical protein
LPLFHSPNGGRSLFKLQELQDFFPHLFIAPFKLRGAAE